MKKSVLQLQQMKAPVREKQENSTISVFCLIKSNLSITNCLNDPEPPTE